MRFAPRRRVIPLPSSWLTNVYVHLAVGSAALGFLVFFFLCFTPLERNEGVRWKSCQFFEEAAIKTRWWSHTRPNTWETAAAEARRSRTGPPLASNFIQAQSRLGPANVILRDG